MPSLVHLTPAANAPAVGRSGLRGPVFCFPVLDSYPLTHQWLRELRRRGQRTFVAVDLRIPDLEPVEVGHYAREHQTMTAAEAVGLIRGLSDPRGFQIVIPRRVDRAEVRRVRAVSGPLGWRYLPDAHGRKPCGCPGCTTPGAFGMARIRAHVRGERRPYSQVLVDLHSDTVDTALAALWELTRIRRRNRGRVTDVLHLLEHPDPEVRETLAYVLPGYRGPEAAGMLARLAVDPEPAVREAAETETS